MLLSDAMSFADFREVAQPSHGKLIVEVLQLLVKDKVGTDLLHKFCSSNIDFKIMKQKILISFSIQKWNHIYLTSLQGPVWIQEKWEAAKLEWTDCSLVDKVDKFVKQNVCLGLVFV